MKILHFLPVALIASCTLHASASSISIGLQEAGTNGGAITTVASDGGTGFAGYAGGYGTFTFNLVLASGYPDPAYAQGSLASGSVQTSALRAGTLTVYVTQSGLTAPTGPTNFASSFSVDDFEGSAVSIVESTYFSPVNALYGGTLLGSQTFTGSGTGDAAIMEMLTGTYSETQKYVITVGRGTSAVSGAINLNATNVVTPEPSSLALLGTGLLGVAGVLKRRVFSA